MFIFASTSATIHAHILPVRGRPGVIVSQTAYMHLPLRTAMDCPELEPGSIFTIHSSAYEAAALTNCANNPNDTEHFLSLYSILIHHLSALC